MIQGKWWIKGIAFVGVVLILAGGCDKARETGEKVADEVTGYRAVKQGRKTMKKLREANKKAQEHNEKMQKMLKNLND